MMDPMISQNNRNLQFQPGLAILEELFYHYGGEISSIRFQSPNLISLHFRFLIAQGVDERIKKIVFDMQLKATNNFTFAFYQAEVFRFQFSINNFGDSVYDFDTYLPKTTYF
jgi:hypothetical protein